MVLYRPHHGIQFPGTRFDLVWMHTIGSKLEQGNQGKMLGERYSAFEFHPRYHERLDGRHVRRGTNHLPVASSVAKAYPVESASRLPLEYRVSANPHPLFTKLEKLTEKSATICSIFKTIELKTLTKTRDPTWDGVNLAIWSGSELYVGILIASLPPLRKAFDDLFRRYFPALGRTTRSNTNGYENYGKDTSGSHNVHLQTFGSKNPRAPVRGPGESVLDSDDESAKGILEETHGKGDGIRKTTQVTIDEERSIDSPSHPVEQELWMDPTGRIRQGPPQAM